MLRQSLMASLMVLALATPAFAAEKGYQVTGPVVDVTADSIVVMKGKEKWSIAKGSATLPDGLKAGDKVTVYYTMTATEVESKEAKKAEKKEEKKVEKKEEKKAAPATPATPAAPSAPAAK